LTQEEEPTDQMTIDLARTALVLIDVENQAGSGGV
jgi:hypothetical protein